MSDTFCNQLKQSLHITLTIMTPPSVLRQQSKLRHKATESTQFSRQLNLTKLTANKHKASEHPQHDRVALTLSVTSD